MSGRLTHGSMPPGCHIPHKDDKAPMAHDVFDVVPEDPEIQHIADQMHPATVEKHAGENSGVRRNRDDLRGKPPAEHDGGNGAEPVDEGFTGGRPGALVEKDEEQATMNATVTTGVRSVGLSSLSGSIAI